MSDFDVMTKIAFCRYVEHLNTRDRYYVTCHIRHRLSDSRGSSTRRTCHQHGTPHAREIVLYTMSIRFGKRSSCQSFLTLILIAEIVFIKYY